MFEAEYNPFAAGQQEELAVAQEWGGYTQFLAQAFEKSP
jgi:hypothetical protein